MPRVLLKTNKTRERPKETSIQPNLAQGATERGENSWLVILFVHFLKKEFLLSLTSLDRI